MRDLPSSAPGKWRVRSMPDLIISVIAIVGGAGVIIYASGMPRLNTGMLGPGLFPISVGIMFIIFGTILLFQTLRGSTHGEFNEDIAIQAEESVGDELELAEDEGNVVVVDESRTRLVVNAVVVAGGVVAYMLLAEHLGFIITMMLILLVIQKVLGGSWLSSILISAGLTFGLYLMFEKLLLVQLPDGLMGF